MIIYFLFVSFDELEESDEEDDTFDDDDTDSGTPQQRLSTSTPRVAVPVIDHLTTTRTPTKPAASLPASRRSRVSSTDSPSETGSNPMASTAAFAYDGHHNKLGLVCVDIVSAIGLDTPPPVKVRHVSLPTQSELSEGCGAYWTATVNGGLTRQTSALSRYMPGLALKWPGTARHVFYALSSRQLVLTCRCCQMSTEHATTAPHREYTKDPCLAVATLSLGKIAKLGANESYPYSQTDPEAAKLVSGGEASESSDTKKMKLAPSGTINFQATFTGQWRFQISW